MLERTAVSMHRNVVDQLTTAPHQYYVRCPGLGWDPVVVGTPIWQEKGIIFKPRSLDDGGGIVSVYVPDGSVQLIAVRDEGDGSHGIIFHVASDVAPRRAPQL